MKLDYNVKEFIVGSSFLIGFVLFCLGIYYAIQRPFTSGLTVKSVSSDGMTYTVDNLGTIVTVYNNDTSHPHTYKVGDLAPVSLSYGKYIFSDSVVPTEGFWGIWITSILLMVVAPIIEMTL